MEDYREDYKELYFKLFGACEQAINILIAAQQECEEYYISLPEKKLQEIPLPGENQKDMEEE